MNKIKIIVMEDDEPIKHVIKEFLQMNDYEVHLPSSIADLIEHLEEINPDMLITDILMPDIDGIEVMLLCKQFKPDIYIIAISGGGRIDAEHYLRLATELGANAILRKPFTVNELLKSIEKVLGEK